MIKIKDLLNIVSVRTGNILRRFLWKANSKVERFVRIDDLPITYITNLTEEELLKLNQLGQTSIQEIAAGLASFDLSLKGYIPNKVIVNPNRTKAALKIIKEKGLSFIEIALIKVCDTYQEYECEVANRVYPHSFENEKAKKTRKEFILLKEILK